MKIKFRMTILINLIMLAMALTACSSGTEDMVKEPDASDVSEISADKTESAASEAADEVASTQEIPNEPLPAPETYEYYIKLSDTYLQADDVIQALAVLDEGIEKLSAGGQGTESQGVDLLSQRKEYILAGMVAVRIWCAEYEYDDGGEIRFGSISERDANGNEILFGYCGMERTANTEEECLYDANGNEIEYGYKVYDNNGNISYLTRWTKTYDMNGKELEYRYYGRDGNIVERTEREYDDFGNEIVYASYNRDGECTDKRVMDYDERGNMTRLIQYGSNGRIDAKWEYEYDENDNEIKFLYYRGDSTVSSWEEREYDENSNIVKFAEYANDGAIVYWDEYEYDENGNPRKYISYDSEGNFRHMTEYEYDQNGREIYKKGYDNNGFITYTWEYEYDEYGNKIKETETDYDEETEQKGFQTIDEYEYDENENMTKYSHIVYDEENGTYSRRWERKYDADGRETDFYLCINEENASYHSQTEYDENGRMISYTEYDKNGAVFGWKETEYDADGNVIKESHYGADGSLIQYYENEYDDFGNVTRQAMYEGGILKTGKKMSYKYHYIENKDTGAADDFTRFLKGQEEVCYHSRAGRTDDGIIVRKSITNLINFSYYQQHRIVPRYAFLDMTGDGVEELIISCDRGELYVIQNDHGILKVIFHTEAHSNTKLVEGNGRTGICVTLDDEESVNETYHVYETYHFLDENGKKEISLYVEWNSEDEEYSSNDNDSFGWHSISEGEYYDITDKMIPLIDINWQKLEDPNYGND